MSNGWKIALMVSLALNVFAAGHLSGKIVSADRGGHHGGPPLRENGPLRLLRYTDELPPAARDKIREQIRSNLPAVRDQFREMRVHHDELMSLLAADDWDGDAVLTKLEAIHGVQSGQRREMSEVFVNAFGGLTAQERQMLVEKARNDDARRDGWRERRRRER